MAYLQLAEENPYNRLAEGKNVMSNYIFIPAGMLGVAKDTYVREDFFDNLSTDEYKKVIESLAPYQNTGLSVLPIAAIGSGVKLIGNLIKRRQDRVASGQAKPLIKAGGILDKIKTKLTQARATSQTDQNAVVGGSAIAPVGSSAMAKTTPFDVSGSASIGGTDVNFQTSGGDSTQPSFFTKYKTPLIIGGVAVGGFLAYQLLKPKKRRR